MNIVDHRNALIEVAGVDGSGKSTLAHAIAGSLICSGTPTYVRSFHSWVRRSATAIARRRGRDRATYIGHESVEFAVAMELLDRSAQLRTAAGGPAAFVLDPYAFSAAAVAATHRVGNLDAILDVYFAVPRPDMVLYLDIDPQVAYQRILARDGSDNVTLRGGVADLTAYREAFERVSPRFVAAGFPIVRLDGRRPIADLVASVHKRLGQLARESEAGTVNYVDG